MPLLRRRAAYRNYRIDQGFGQPFTLNKHSPQARGLVGWWPTLGFSGGNMLRDRSGLGNHGTLPGGGASPAWTTTVDQGLALDYDGSADYVTVADSPSLDFTSQITIAGWIFPHDLTGPPFPCLVEKGHSAQWNLILDYAGAATLGDEMRLIININATREDIHVTPVGFQLNQWQHVAATYDGATVALYKNGVDLGATHTPGETPPTFTGAIGTDADELRIADFTDQGFFDGLISDVRIHNYALPGSVIHEMYAPATRWDLYQPLARAFFMHVPAAVGGTILPQMMQHYHGSYG